MTRVDLHIHSKYSSHPTEWFLKRIGTSESYTEPEFIYAAAKAHGMDYVTITDHNAIKGALRLQEAHPEDTFLGVESTAYFPEDGCKVHVLVYDLTEWQFNQIQKLRKNIYELCAYLKDQRLPHSLAHATYSIQGVLQTEHIEKLTLLFDTFETLNGGRNHRTNETLEAYFDRLTETDIERLADKHGIEPFSDTSWQKRYTGGSDDHAGLFIGKTYTEADAETLADFLHELREGSCTASGRHHDFSSMAFSIFKIAYEFAKSKKSNFAGVPLRLVTDLVFANRKLNIFEDLAVNFLGRKKTVKKKKIRHLYGDLMKELKGASERGIEEKLSILYDKVAALSDSLVADLIARTKKSVVNGKLDGLARTLASSLPMIFLTVPFFSTFANMNNNRNLIEDVRTGLGWEPERKKRILWFTDTLCDLNGVATSLTEIGELASQYDIPIMLATAFDDGADCSSLPPHVMQLPLVTSFPIPEYENMNIRVPSLLHSLKLAQQFDPDEIYISSPAIIGLVGLLIAKLMKIKAVGVYHTDFTLQAAKVIDDGTVTHYLDEYMRWFYGACDRVLSNTPGYIDILKNRGYDVSKMKIFERGINTDVFKPVEEAGQAAAELWGINSTPFVLYAGRVSKDKSVDLLIHAHLAIRRENLNLVIAGDGPDLEELKHRYRREGSIKFLGRVSHDKMPVLFSAARLFAFPSTTDTFGRVVLEAMACGTPALVSAVGGPQELIIPDVTGRVVWQQSISAWTREIERLKRETDEDTNGIIANRTREYVLKNYGIDKYFQQLMVLPELVHHKPVSLVSA